MSKCDIGDRMKSYESSERFMPQLPIIIRVDGKCFSKFTGGLKLPHDERFSEIMQATARWLVEQTGARFGFTQSDEISLVFLKELPYEETIFGGKIQKLISVVASMTTAKFNQQRALLLSEFKPEQMALFDGRAFQVPNKTEAINYFLWRWQDARKNAISMATRSFFSHNAMYKKSCEEMLEMLVEVGVDFYSEYPEAFKYGTFIQKLKKKRVLTEDERLKIPVKYRPQTFAEVLRTDIRFMHISNFLSVTNKEEVIFDGATPKIN